MVTRHAPARFLARFMAGATPRERIAFQTLAIVVPLTLLNLAVNLVAIADGRGFPYSSFLFRSDDNFADFFSMLLGYPDGALAHVGDRSGLHAILPLHSTTDVLSANGRHPQLTIFHMPPLPTILSLATLRLLRFVDPVVLFLLLITGLLTYWCVVSSRFARTRREAGAWIVLGLVSYPSLMMFVRGNLFSGLTALLLVNALLLGLKRRAPVAAAVMLAVAVNIRPNAILLALPLLAFYWRVRWRFAIALASCGCTTFAASLAASTALFPAYRMASFLAGLRVYYERYVVHSWGLSYGSSLYGGLKLFFGYRPGLDGIATLVSLAILAGALTAYARGRIDDAALIFLAIAAYCLGSTVLADYHLIVLLVIPLALALAADDGNAREATTTRLALVTTGLILAPKNLYFFVDTISVQVLLNPLLLLRASLYMLAPAFGYGGATEARPSGAPSLASG